MTISNDNSADTITISIDDSDYVSNGGYVLSSSSGNSYTIGTGVTGASYDFSNITISNGGTSSSTMGSTVGFNWSMIDTVPFDNGFPDWDDFQHMCEEYPALKIAYEHMKVFYKLSQDDWEAKKRGEDV